MKKERPILFSTPMIQALLAGRKTQTRRIIKRQPAEGEGVGDCPWCNSGWSFCTIEGACLCMELTCPYGNIGDILWAKEAFWEYGRWVATDDPKMKNGKEWHPLACEPIRFVADDPKLEPAKGLEWSMGYQWRKMSSLFLRKEHARIWMDETNIRAERVRDITYMDAMAEGIQEFSKDGILSKFGLDNWIWSVMNRDGKTPVMQKAPQEAYEALWISINGLESLLANPWTWAISFNVLSTTGRPDNK